MGLSGRMNGERYIQTLVTVDFLNKVFKKYTERLRMIEGKKNGVKKRRITKALVCKEIIKDLEMTRLI